MTNDIRIRSAQGNQNTARNETVAPVRDPYGVML
jgi:hypothetical protein